MLKNITSSEGEKREWQNRKKKQKIAVGLDLTMQTAFLGFCDRHNNSNDKSNTNMSYTIIEMIKYEYVVYNNSNDKSIIYRP